MSSPLVQGWLYATVPVDNQWGGTGTGFLVFRTWGENQGRVFLVTNKHVVHENPGQRMAASHIVCHFNTRENDGTAARLAEGIVLTNRDGSKRYREHPNADTDVLAVDVTDVMLANPKIEKKWATYESFAEEPRRAELDITAGEEVVTIGYPLGLRQGDTNFPLLRQGIIATRIGYPIRDKVRNADGTYRDRVLRAFLVDGAVVPGSSGSPVVLKPVIGRQVGNAIQLGTAPPVLLGIVAETKYAPVQVGQGIIPGFAGLGLAFEVETIRETIELFFTSQA
jgi:S1-C subfamily serine protease